MLIVFVFSLSLSNAAGVAAAKFITWSPHQQQPGLDMAGQDPSCYSQYQNQWEREEG